MRESIRIRTYLKWPGRFNCEIDSNVPRCRQAGHRRFKTVPVEFVNARTRKIMILLFGDVEQRAWNQYDGLPAHQNRLTLSTHVQIARPVKNRTGASKLASCPCVR